ncbi:MAG: dethiobiotin synthase [Planctomycetaceae bacterium]|nr:dethiobiotin synthase [Planctomycetaceae bacterium]
MRGLFITGTDTGVGKTWITGTIARQLLQQDELTVGLYKPVCSGAERRDDGTLCWPDLEHLYSALKEKYSREHICPQLFEAPLAPPVAAAAEGTQVDAELLLSGVDWWRSRVDLLVIEGVGGWYCPLTETEMVADYVTTLGYPVVIVARLGLGTINHTLLTLEAVRARRLSVAGVVLNEAVSLADDASIETNAEEIEKWGKTEVLGVMRHRQAYLPRNGTETDWFSLASPSSAGGTRPNLG